MIRYVESLNRALHQLLAEDPRVYLLGEDVLDPYGGAFKVSQGLSSAFPERVITTPISEAGITGVATGMAMRGLRPIVEVMFGDFLTLCVDQIVNGAAKFQWMSNGQAETPIVIRTPMGGRRGYGPTHSQTLEHLLMGVPGLKIVAPSHFHDPGLMLKACVTRQDSPVLFVENKSLYPVRLIDPDQSGSSSDFTIRTVEGSDRVFPTMSLRLDEEPPDVTIIAYGGMAILAADAALSAFLNDELRVEVLLPSQVKPVPISDLLPSVRSTGKVVVAEESPRTGGWGAEVAAQLQECARGYLSSHVARIGSEDVPIPSAASMEKQVLPQVEDILAAVHAQVRQ